MSDNQIIQNLQRQGFDSTSVLDALNQAEAKGAVGAGPIPSGIQPSSEMGHYHMPEHPAENDKRFEEIAESIVKEKIEEHMQEINKITDWKDKTDERLAAIEQSIKDVKSDLDNLHKAIVGKISEYDRNILDVGTEMKAMEKVFKKILPEFTQNINELSRVTKSIKKK